MKDDSGHTATSYTRDQSIADVIQEHSVKVSSMFTIIILVHELSSLSATGVGQGNSETGLVAVVTRTPLHVVTCRQEQS